MRDVDRRRPRILRTRPGHACARVPRSQGDYRTVSSVRNYREQEMINFGGIREMGCLCVTQVYMTVMNQEFALSFIFLVLACKRWLLTVLSSKIIIDGMRLKKHSQRSGFEPIRVDHASGCPPKPCFHRVDIYTPRVHLIYTLNTLFTCTTSPARLSHILM